MGDCLALIEVHVGNEPVRDHHWPAGTLDVANLDNRLGYWVGPPFGGGEYHFEYRGDTDAFQRTLDLAAKIESSEPVRLVVHEGPAAPSILTGREPDAKNAGYDWAFTFWDPKSYERLYTKSNSSFLANEPGGNFGAPLPPPRVDVYIGGKPEGRGVDWPRVKVPENIKVSDSGPRRTTTPSRRGPSSAAG